VSRPGLIAALAIVGGGLVLRAPAVASDFKVWPLIDYHSERSGQRRLHLLGPLFSYETGPQRTEVALRPLFALTREPGRSRSQFTVLYPLFVTRRDPRSTDQGFFGLINYRTYSAPRPDEWDRRFTIFPILFYRASHTRGTWLSVLPFYANVENFLGYEHIRMIAFPLYLRLQSKLVERTWLPFPFVSWTGGTLGRGYRLWPFYGWEQDGDLERFTYVLWPLYISHDLHFTRPEREQRRILFPFYAGVDSATRRSRGYGTVFLTHTVDQQAHTETWGFPWPFWVSQRNLRTGERTTLRFAPFYGYARFGDRRSRFWMWPVYRWSTQEVGAYRHTRSDVLFVLFRNIEEVQLERHHHRRLQTLFPLYRAATDDGASEVSAPALLDALVPRNATVQQVYAPWWRLYHWQQDGERPPRWSLLWDLVSSDGVHTRYPVYVNLSDAE
jgi:hypothetical protein